MRRLLALLFLLGVPAFASSQIVTVLLDTSYSMSLVDGGRSRLDTLVDALERDLASRPASTSYALVAASHGAELDLLLPFPALRPSVLAAARAAVPFGSLDLARAITAGGRLAASIASTAGAETAELLLVTDAEDLQAVTGGTPPSLPRGVALRLIAPEDGGPASIAPFLDHIARAGPRGVLTRVAPATVLPSVQAGPIDPLAPPFSTGAVSPGPTSPAADEHTASAPAPADAGDRPEQSGAGGVPPEVSGSAPASAEPSPAPRGVQSLVRRWALIARWAFAAATILGAIGWLKAVARHRRRVEAVARHNARPPTILLDVRSAVGRDELELNDFPANLGPGSGLPAGHGNEANRSITIEIRDGRPVLASTDGVLVNGTARTFHEMTDRDQIRLGKVRLIVREVRFVKPIPPPRPRHRRYPLPAGAALILAVAGIIYSAPARQEPPPDHVRVATGRPEQPRAEREAEREQAADSAAEPEAASSMDAVGTSDAAAERGAHETVPPWITRRPMPRLTLPIVVAPDAEVPEEALDYLVIHAHPDDESIDFGAMVARFTELGMRGGVVLLTDGESGRDQYPARGVDATYPPFDLTGRSLARVRIQEAREAIGWLGSELYVRVGLSNAPYNSVTEERAPSEVLDEWGGVDRVVDRLAEIARRLRPRLILSPDVPSDAREHFEHEATGIAVAELVRRLRDDPSSRLEAHVVCVDPLQRGAYDDLVEVSPWQDGAARARLRQLLALRSHRTQRDAVVIGVETRLALPADVYRVPYVRSGVRLDRILGPAAVDRGAGSP